MTQQKVQGTAVISQILNQHLIPDLTQLVLKYCWSEKCNFYDLCFYGNYKKLSTIENDDWNWGLYYACRGMITITQSILSDSILIILYSD